MKTRNLGKIALVIVGLLFTVEQSKAQLIPNTYMNIDWQVGVPLGDSFADKASGWGMNFEGGYFFTKGFAMGLFINFQTNMESIPRQTLHLSDGAALTTNQKHALFQLPFGVTGRYEWLPESIFQPYVGMKLGASWALFSSYYYIV